MEDCDEKDGQPQKSSRSCKSLLTLDVRRRHHEIPPAHHVVSKIEARLLASIPSAISSAQALIATPFEALPGSCKEEEGVESVIDKEDGGNVGISKHSSLRGFCNPWPSWHKPRIGEIWNGLRWTRKGNDDSLDVKDVQDEPVASSSVGDASEVQAEEQMIEPSLPDLQKQSKSGKGPYVVQKDFSEPIEGIAKATWLGHASVLLQLPPFGSVSDGHKDSLNILFDPIFSMRCSPSQYVGPLRFFPSPCSIQSLPRIDLIFISHSHYDHLDHDSIVALWQLHQEHVHFLVPLGLKDWFLSLDIAIPHERITELDWWDEVWLRDGSSNMPKDQLRVVCTPAQHGSGRFGLDASRSLWASWTLEYIMQGNTFRVFFGGDTGFQFQSSSSNANAFPTCPAFAEVCKYIGKPDLSFLPISVGASFNFIKSYDMLGVVPDVDHGLTAANHLTPHDAVRVAKILRDFDEDGNTLKADQLGGVAMAIHWGTFIVDLEEAQQTMRDLKRACETLQVDYISGLDERNDGDRIKVEHGRLQFACVNHGQSIYLSMHAK